MYALTVEPDEQHDVILNALKVAIQMGLLLSPQAQALASQDILTPTEEYQALQLLIQNKCRNPLRKALISFPTRSTFQERLSVQPDSEGWTVKNLSKQTEYRVTESGYHLDCTCDSYGNGFCKHRDLVRDWWAGKTTMPQKLTFVAPPTPPPALPVSSALPDLPNLDHTSPADPDVSGDLPELFPGFTPTKDQWLALTALKDWWLHSSDAFFRLQGFAGTGKTTLIQAFILWLLNEIEETNTDIAFTAPTNKATRVQAQMLSKWQLHSLEPITCARLLGIKGHKVDDKQYFKKDPDAEPEIDHYDLIIVDEISMINEELWSLFLDEAGPSLLGSKRFILMGDPAQLPPIGEAESAAFSHDCTSTELKEVKRYGGPIGTLAHQFRSHLNAKRFPTITTKTEDGKGIWVCTEQDWFALIGQAFTSTNYEKDATHSRALAWTNKRVAYLNDRIRAMLGRQGEYELSERLIASTPYTGGATTPLFATSTEMEVTSVQEGFSDGYPVWFLECEIQDEDRIVTVPVLQRSAQKTFDAQLKEYRQKKQWFSYWGLKETFAWLDYSYAMTVHKSQGSTFRNVFIDIRDIARNSTKRCRPSDDLLVWERNQLAYVAISRSSDRLFIFQ